MHIIQIGKKHFYDVSLVTAVWFTNGKVRFELRCFGEDECVNVEDYTTSFLSAVDSLNGSGVSLLDAYNRHCAERALEG